MSERTEPPPARVEDALGTAFAMQRLATHVEQMATLIAEFAAHEPYFTDGEFGTVCVFCGSSVREDRDELSQHSRMCPHVRASRLTHPDGGAA